MLYNLVFAQQDSISKKEQLSNSKDDLHDESILKLVKGLFKDSNSNNSNDKSINDQSIKNNSTTNNDRESNSKDKGS